MSTLPRRNIGVTGFMSAGELVAVQQRFAQLCDLYQATPRLMAGVLVSDKTATGEMNRHPGRFPRPEALPALLAPVGAQTLALAHFNTHDVSGLVEQCERVLDVAGPNLHGFQLNICFPEPSLVQELRKRHPKLHILLQLGGHALRKVRHDGQLLLERLAGYEGCIDEVLLDPSGGKGIPLQAERLLPLVEALMCVKGLGIGACGGLSATTMSLVAPIARICPFISVDAEGLVRDKVTDALLLGEVDAYLVSAFDLLCP